MTHYAFFGLFNNFMTKLMPKNALDFSTKTSKPKQNIESWEEAFWRFPCFWSRFFRKSTFWPSSRSLLQHVRRSISTGNCVFDRRARQKAHGSAPRWKDFNWLLEVGGPVCKSSPSPDDREDSCGLRLRRYTSRSLCCSWRKCGRFQLHSVLFVS